MLLVLLLANDLSRTRSWRRQQAARSAGFGAQITVVMMSASEKRRQNQLALIAHYANHPLVKKFLWIWNVRIDKAHVRKQIPETNGALPSRPRELIVFSQR